LFQAFEVLSQRGHNKFHLLVIGDGPQRGKLQKLQRRYRKHLMDFLLRRLSELARYYRAADLLFIPASRKRLDLWRWKVRPAARPW
jgi:glycosyltransferase involved in cell wall biosynthesis